MYYIPNTMVWQLVCCIETTNKKPLELSLLRVLCLESFLELLSYSFTSPQNPVVIAHELSAQFIVRYSGWDVKGLWLKFVIVLLYILFLALASGFLNSFYFKIRINIRKMFTLKYKMNTFFSNYIFEFIIRIV